MQKLLFSSIFVALGPAVVNAQGQFKLVCGFSFRLTDVYRILNGPTNMHSGPL